MQISTGSVLESAAPIAVQVQTMSSPFGPLTLACTDMGLCWLDNAEAQDMEERLARRFAVGTIHEGPIAQHACTRLGCYFRGELRTFDIAIDLRGLPPFQQRVLHALCAVPFGSACSYRELAGHIGQPGAARAVGNAVGRNPMPIVVPCHRVLAAGGGLGGFSWGLDRKRFLLDLEGIATKPPRRHSLDLQFSNNSQ